MRNRQWKHRRGELLPVFTLAFGVGLFVALFCSAKLALLIAVSLLIYIGLTKRSC